MRTVIVILIICLHLPADAEEQSSMAMRISTKLLHAIEKKYGSDLRHAAALRAIGFIKLSQAIDPTVPELNDFTYDHLSTHFETEFTKMGWGGTEGEIILGCTQVAIIFYQHGVYETSKIHFDMMPPEKQIIYMEQYQKFAERLLKERHILKKK